MGAVIDYIITIIRTLAALRRKIIGVCCRASVREYRGERDEKRFRPCVYNVSFSAPDGDGLKWISTVFFLLRPRLKYYINIISFFFFVILYFPLGARVVFVFSRIWCTNRVITNISTNTRARLCNGGGGQRFSTHILQNSAVVFVRTHKYSY